MRTKFAAVLLASLLLFLQALELASFRTLFLTNILPPLRLYRK